MAFSLSVRHRYVVLAIVFGAYFFCYMDRMVMASAIPFIAKDFQLSALKMGVVLSAFFAGYALMQIPGGLLADYFGPRIVMTGSVLWFSLLTALTGTAGGLNTLLAVRALFGLGEGPFPAAASKSVANWFPPEEAGRASGVLLGSTYLGATVAPLFVTTFVIAWGWRSAFYALLFPGLTLACLVWCYLKQPASVSHAGPTRTRDNLLLCLRTPAVLWSAGSLLLSNTVAWGLMNWLPTYLLDGRGFGVEKMGLFTAVTNLAGAAGYIVGGQLCDRFFSRNMRTPIILGLLLSSMLTYLAAIAPSGEWAVFWLALVFFISNVAFTAIFTLPVLIVPPHAVGSAFGIVNTAGQIAGVIAPVLVGGILELTHGDFHVVMYTMVALAAVAAFPAFNIRFSQPSHEVAT